MTDTAPPNSASTIDMDLQIPSATSGGEPRLIWRNRTKMAWGCFALNVAVFVALCALPVERVNAAKEVLTNILYADVLIIATYFGTTALPFITGRK